VQSSIIFTARPGVHDAEKMKEETSIECNTKKENIHAKIIEHTGKTKKYTSCVSDDLAFV